jgi:hypothetical protein
MDASGQIHGFAIQRKNMPFTIDPIQRDPRTGLGNGKRVQMVVTQPGGAPINMYCWVPSTITVDDLSRAVLKTSKNGRWKSVLTRVKNGRSIPDAGSRSALSAEARAFEAEVLLPSSQNGASNITTAARNDGCLDVRAEIEYYWEEGDAWITITVEFTDCDSGGGGDVFCWVIDNGYDDPPHVVVDADAYDVITGDSVTFVAEVVSDVHLSATGWQWTPANGYASDPWTAACAGTATTCNKVEIHSTGTMAYTVQDAVGNNITGQVRIVADLPPDIASLGDDGDAPGTSASNTPVNTVALTQSEGDSVLATAKASGEWTYTQGCAHCKSPHGNVNGAINSEYPVDYGLRRGDCTDLVFYSLRTYLGTTAWPFEKISTAEFNTWSDTAPTRLARHGYVQIDSSQVRRGDAVLKTSLSGGGHAGIFMLWGVGGVPVAYANNGSPADSTKAGKDTTTGRWTARKAPGTVIKYFRALKVVP